jgi:hypothetical protein
MLRPSMALALALVLAALTASAAHAKGDDWTQRLAPDLAASDLGLAADASPAELARGALARSAPRLGLPASLRGVRLERRLPAPGQLDVLRFQQTAGGERVVWSQIDVAVAGGEVSSISATVVPVDGARGQRRIGRDRAVAIARGAVEGRERVVQAQRVAYAGRPGAGSKRAARRAWLVETTPASERGEESPTGLCVVVDAATGKVIDTWKGSAARPSRPARARKAASEYRAVVDVFADNTNRYYARYIVRGNPRHWSNWPSLAKARSYASSGNVPDNPLLDKLAENAKKVGWTLCARRNYCGRTGGFDGDATIEPWKVHYWPGATASRANRSTLGILMAKRSIVGASQLNDVMAHEFGHVMDWVYAGDRLVSFLGQEVEEGLADMFAYDFDRLDATLGEDAGGVRIDWLNPGAVSYSGQQMPDHMMGYDCTPPGFRTGDPADPHYNSTILSHGYYLFVQAVGHSIAGNVLQYIPYFLDPNPRFVDVKSGFNTRAAQLYPGNPDIPWESKDAFVNGVGIGLFDPPGC